LCDVILKSTKNTNELIQLIEFINNTRDNILPELEKQIIEMLLCETFLLGYIQFTNKELKPYTTTFQWVKRIHKLIFNSHHTIKEKSKEFKEDLSNQIKIFNTKLENYKSELNEYPQLGDLNDINIYAKKSQILDDKLTEALETIDEFNRLENYYGLKESVYPLRKFVRIISKKFKI